MGNLEVSDSENEEVGKQKEEFLWGGNRNFGKNIVLESECMSSNCTATTATFVICKLQNFFFDKRQIIKTTCHTKFCRKFNITVKTL